MLLRSPLSASLFYRLIAAASSNLEATVSCSAQAPVRVFGCTPPAVIVVKAARRTSAPEHLCSLFSLRHDTQPVSCPSDVTGASSTRSTATTADRRAESTAAVGFRSPAFVWPSGRRPCRSTSDLAACSEQHRAKREHRLQLPVTPLLPRLHQPCATRRRTLRRSHRQTPALGSPSVATTVTPLEPSRATRTYT